MFRKVTQGVPCGNYPHSKTQNRELDCLNDIFCQNKFSGEFFYVIWDRKIAKAKFISKKVEI